MDRGLLLSVLANRPAAGCGCGGPHAQARNILQLQSQPGVLAYLSSLNPRKLAVTTSY